MLFPGGISNKHTKAAVKAKDIIQFQINEIPKSVPTCAKLQRSRPCWRREWVGSGRVLFKENNVQYLAINTEVVARSFSKFNQGRWKTNGRPMNLTFVPSRFDVTLICLYALHSNHTTEIESFHNSNLSKVPVECKGRWRLQCRVYFVSEMDTNTMQSVYTGKGYGIYKQERTQKSRAVICRFCKEHYLRITSTHFPPFPDTVITYKEGFPRHVVPARVYIYI